METTMNKMSQAETGQMMKLAANSLRVLSEEKSTLLEKVASQELELQTFRKRERAEKIAQAMEEKGLEPELSVGEKISGLMKKDNLDVIEEAVGMTAPQMKLAGVANDSRVTVEGGTGSPAEDTFLNNVLSLSETS